MAVMSTSLMDKPSFDPKGPLAPSSDVMVLESDLNGLAPSADALFQSTNTVDDNTAPSELEQQPTLNGKPQEDAPTDPVPPSLPVAPAENVTSGIGPIAPFLSEISESDPITELPPAIEAPTSDVRNEMEVNTSTEAQNTANLDAMEITDAVAAQDLANDVVDTIITGVEESTKASDHITPNGDNVESPKVGGPLPSQEDPLATESVETAPIEDAIMEDVPSQSKVRPREEDDADEEPSAKRTKTEEADETPASVVPTTTASNSIVDTPIIDAPAVDAPIVDALAQAAAYATQYTPLLPHFDSEPLTDRQRAGLLKVLQGAKKAKPAVLFKTPVDFIALNIPTYPDLVKNPMDLSTMDAKLKDGKYGSVDDFLADVSLIVRNTYTFNGPAHAVSQSGRALESYMVKAVENNAIRGTAETARPKTTKLPTEKKESRRRSTAAKAEKPMVAPPPPTATSPTTTYAPKDGVPIIRRDSTTIDGRPKREIQRPKPRDLPYSVKPRKKKFQIELKFCESVLNEIKKQKYAKISWPFHTPVDPVALNIPNYHKLIKKPMDMSTIEKKLKQGDYQTSKDFKGDFDLMFANCFKFNPENDDIHKMGKLFQEQVNEIWGGKDDWIANHQPQSEPMSSAGEESDEDDDASEDESDTRQRDLNDIQRQITELTNRARNIIQSAAKATSPKARGKKNKASKSSSKSKKSGSGGLGSSKTKVKKPAKPLPPLSFEQKSEISESIGQLNEGDMGKAMQIIKNGCPNLGGGDDEELEIDMEMIPEEVLRQLLRFVRSVRAAANEKPEPISDDEFEPPKASAGKSSKSKKNKPMNKKEQEESIEAIKRQLESFSKPGGSGSEEPISPAMQDDSSSDDEDAASESEEE